METNYKTSVYHVISASIMLFAILVTMIAILIGLGVVTKSPVLGGIGVVIVCLSPLLYQKKFKRRFTKDVDMAFDSNGFYFKFYNLESKGKVELLNYNWDDIDSYKFYFTPSKFTGLDIYCRNGKNKRFIFLDNKTQEESIKQKSIFSIFRFYIKDYNLSKTKEGKIIIRPGFLTTKVGTLVIWCCGILIIASIILHISKFNASIPFLIIGICSFFPLLLKRRQDKKMYEQMSNLDDEIKLL